MLNKKVCKRCWAVGEIEGMDFTRWTIRNEDKWQEGYAFCLAIQDILILNRTLPLPPDECPFKLEHLVTNDAKKNE